MGGLAWAGHIEMTMSKNALPSTTARLLCLALCLLLPGCLGWTARPNQLTLDAPAGSVEWQWAAADFGGQREPHSAILVPVRLAGVERQLYMQFDLGTPSTVFLIERIDALNDRQAGLRLGRDADNQPLLQDVSLQVGTLGLRLASARLVARAAGSEPDWSDPEARIIIGTLGSDLLDGRVLVLDYQHQRLEVAPRLPERFAAVPAHAMSLSERRVLLSAEMEGRPLQLMFDTGSSAFALLTSESSWKRLATPGRPTRQFAVKSWDRQLIAHVAPTEARITLGGHALPLQQVSYIDGSDWKQVLAMRLSPMGGMTGNKLFIGKQLLLDAPAAQYRLIVPQGD